ncbi:ABC transporter ATP-binding protein [Marinilactibacillus kalidii]|uniref:ABC transporter ATP-binding protein n=1 Tax=Marinilactibacillus kalidii TaxID=2820274 RepID=UPI001ABEB94C|nr:ABC transporter ATP-binding protein [Marinilactibacillus kalidii]
MISKSIEPLLENEETLLIRDLFAIPHRKMLTTRYDIAEKSTTREKLSLIDRNNSSSPSSLVLISIKLKKIIPLTISVLWVMILIRPLFAVDTTLIANSYSYSYSWLEPHKVIAGFIISLLVIILLTNSTSRKTNERLEDIYKKFEVMSALFSYEDDVLHDIQSGKEIRMYKQNEKMLKNIDKDNEFSKKIISENYKKMRLVSIASSGFFQTINYLIFAYLGVLVVVGAMPVAMIIQLSSAISQLITVFPQLFQNVMSVFSSPSTLNTYYDFMDMPDQEDNERLRKVLISESNQVEFKQVSFSYPDTEKLVLKNIDATFNFGKRYAIVGENGSGKSTFIKLLTRLYEPTSGVIEINKEDINKFEVGTYLDQLGVVFQDFQLPNFPLGQNLSTDITYDRNKANSLLERVNSKTFVETLPHSTDTVLGKEYDASGINMSGGQEQRLAIARSLYKGAKLLILDEPTAALDPLTEIEIFENFDSIAAGNTAVYISHRLSSTKFSDEILVFDKGEIVQRGSHEELSKIDGKYKELWNAQAQHYI